MWINNLLKIQNYKYTIIYLKMKSNMYKMGNILIDNKSLYLTLSIATKLISL